MNYEPPQLLLSSKQVDEEIVDKIGKDRENKSDVHESDDNSEIKITKEMTILRVKKSGNQGDPT